MNDITQVPMLQSDIDGTLIDADPMPVLSRWRRAGFKSALLTLVEIDGQSPRSIGARMIVREDGVIHGYMTGGCLEKELCLVAQQVIAEGENKLVRYGKDSKFIDIKLPCGSGIDVYFDQNISDEIVTQAAQLVEQRQYFTLSTDIASGTSQIIAGDENVASTMQLPLSGDRFDRLCKPTIRLRVFGAGSAAVQIALCGQQASMQVDLVCTDMLTKMQAESLGIKATLSSDPSSGLASSDPWTASVVAFHEHDREFPLLPRLLQGSDFYIAAIGSVRVAEQRREALASAGVDKANIDRMQMHPGLVPGARNATELGFGIVTEVLRNARAKSLV